MKLSTDSHKNRLSLKGAAVAVLGAARSGIAVSQLLAESGSRVLLSDLKSAGDLDLDILKFKWLGIEIETGGHSERILESDLICISPGLPLTIPILKRATERKIPIVGEIELSSWFCSDPIYAITGSNGKTTTTALSGDIFRKRDGSTAVAGNIGLPFAEIVFRKAKHKWVILEISSFQLETIVSFHPRIAVIMNLTANHLDRYPDFDSYAQAKLNILKNMTADDILIYNLDDKYLSEALSDAIPRCLGFSLSPHSQEGAYWVNNKIVIQLAGRKDCIYLKNLLLRGPHNRFNMMVAALLATLDEIPVKIISRQISGFKGIEHRLELVRRIGDVSFFNDSKATTVDSLIYGLKSFDDNIILIAGGKDKGGEFSEANELLKNRVKTVLLLGQAADRMTVAWQEVVPLERMESLQDAVNRAYSMAEPGDTVLLSPACSSFDMFRDYEDRGNQFKKFVADLK
ncbi:MAG: UDP-N-acetylmuramoyl-L-alanine--D-glutamate ligase [Calditrichae bacterium]|nr:UDP-N-acetylmuramoyl-L-alanine--D-glutamate ligase [Calditrichia bacterium]